MIHYAIEFAVKAHGNQKRKYTNLPYIMHPMSVAGIVSTVTNDTHMLTAAILHDTVEDTNVTLADIGFKFGVEIEQLVEELTDTSIPQDGNRSERKAIDREHSANASPEGQTIKVADLIDNTCTIAYLDKNFAKVYMREKQLLLEALTKADKALLEIANRQVSEYYMLLQEERIDIDTFEFVKSETNIKGRE